LYFPSTLIPFSIKGGTFLALKAFYGLHTLHLETVCDTAQTWLHTYALEPTFGRDPIFATILALEYEILVKSKWCMYKDANESWF
jgi:hypothetical protein